jgi:hypothetical protein
MLNTPNILIYTWELAILISNTVLQVAGRHEDYSQFLLLNSASGYQDPARSCESGPVMFIDQAYFIIEGG